MSRTAWAFLASEYTVEESLLTRLPLATVLAHVVGQAGAEADRIEVANHGVTNDAPTKAPTSKTRKRKKK